MPTVFQKLNLKDQSEIVVLNAPESFEPELQTLEGVTVQRSSAKSKAIHFGLAFAVTQKDLDSASRALVERAEGDAILWIAYPKGTSKKYRCEFNRDSGWKILGDAGFESVRMVAIDDDWSAVRFRRAEHIKSLTRDKKHALSAAGKQRAGRK